MLKLETMHKYVELANSAMKAHRANLVNLSVCISKGNRKIGRCMNVSLLPILTCGHNCKVCNRICYDLNACLQYGNVLNARARNTVLAIYDRDRFFSQIDDAMNRRRKNKFFRWHVGGDLLDLDYFSRIVENARRHPDFIIWTYTKQFDLVNEYVSTHGGTKEKAIPNNLSIMFSEWEGLPMDNMYGFATFTCILKGRAFPSDRYECNGNCEFCIANGVGCPYQMNSAVHEH